MRKENEICIYGTKHTKKIVRIRKIQFSASNRMNYLEFAFNGPNYVRYIVSLVNFFC